MPRANNAIPTSMMFRGSKPVTGSVATGAGELIGCRAAVGTSTLNTTDDATVVEPSLELTLHA
jgi:hypothetical protein